MKGGIGNLMQAAQKMQEQMKKTQAELANVEVEGQAGGGLVKVVVTCANEVRRVVLDASAITSAADDKELLEDLIAAAVNDALSKAQATSQQKMSGLTAGLNLPAGMKLPF